MSNDMQIEAAIGYIYRTARPAMSMSGQAYINGGGPLRAFTKPWTQGELA